MRFAVPVLASSSELNKQTLDFLLRRALNARIRYLEAAVIRLRRSFLSVTTVPSFQNCFPKLEIVLKYSG